MASSVTTASGIPPAEDSAPVQESWITRTPGVCGGQARVRNTRITVWGLVESRRLGFTDGELLREIEGLTLADLRAAWEYAAANAEEIEAAIRLNEAP